MILTVMLKIAVAVLARIPVVVVAAVKVQQSVQKSAWRLIAAVLARISADRFLCMPGGN